MTGNAFIKLGLALGCSTFVLHWRLMEPAPGVVSRAAKPAPRPSATRNEVVTPEVAAQLQALEAQRQQLDRTVWAKELLAQMHEAVFLKLWDELRSREDEFAVLEKFDFEALELGTPKDSETLEHGITRIVFAAPRHRLERSTWRQRLAAFKQEGYRLQQSDWRHARFESGTNGVAHSVVAMTVHAIHPERQQRFVLRGNLHVRWRENADLKGQFSRETEPPLTPSLSRAGEEGARRAGKGESGPFTGRARVYLERAPVPELIDASELELLSQTGPPAFQRTLSQEVAPRANPVFIDPLILYDLDGDGLSEIILACRNTVYWNRGQGVFQTGRLCAHPQTINTGVIADFSGDGAADFLAADAAGLLLFRGNNHGRFAEPARRIKFTDAPLPNPFVLTAGDIDGDGDLDVWLAQYKLPYVAGQMPTPYYDANDGFPSFLLLNDGSGQFRDHTEAAGLAVKRFRRTYSSSFVDLDDDGDLDLVVVSDFAGVDLHYNDGRGHFTDRTSSVVDEPHGFGMAHSVGDFDADGTLDLLMVGMNSYVAGRLEGMRLGPAQVGVDLAMRPKMAQGNRLYFSRDGRFKQTSASLQVSQSGWSWGATSFDFDNDGDLDIYIANGHKSRASVKDYESQFWRHDLYVGTSRHDPVADAYFKSVGTKLYGDGQSYGGYEKNRFFVNRSGENFVEVGHLLGLALETDCRNLVSDDLDGDGRMDLLVTTFAEWPQSRQGLHLFRNQTGASGNWIGVRLRESGPGFSPMGAKITLFAPGGRQMRHVVTGDSYRSQHAPTAHFGLGGQTRVEQVEIRWPNGLIRRLVKPAINRYHEVAGP